MSVRLARVLSRLADVLAWRFSHSAGPWDYWENGRTLARHASFAHGRGYAPPDRAWLGCGSGRATLRGAGGRLEEVR